MEENSKEKKEVKKITYEEVCEEALLSFIDEKMSKDASCLSKEELRKAFNKIRNTVLDNPKAFENTRDKLIGVYKSKGLYDEDTDPKVIETREKMAKKSKLGFNSSINEGDVNPGW